MMTECVLWTGAKYSSGYGQARNPLDWRKRTGAHRAAWMKVNGAIPEDREIDHLCNVRLCVNVEHMQLVTRAENMQLMHIRKGKCMKGLHKKETSGACVECRREYQRSPAFKAAVARWEAKNREKRRAYQRRWQSRKRHGSDCHCVYCVEFE